MNVSKLKLEDIDNMDLKMDHECHPNMMGLIMGQ